MLAYLHQLQTGVVTGVKYKATVSHGIGNLFFINHVYMLNEFQVGTFQLLSCELTSPDFPVWSLNVHRLNNELTVAFQSAIFIYDDDDTAFTFIQTVASCIRHGIHFQWLDRYNTPPTSPLTPLDSFSRLYDNSHYQ